MADTKETEKRFLKLVVARHLLGKDAAMDAWKEAQEQQLAIADLLMDKGILTQHAVDQLMQDVQAAMGPRKIGGFRITKELGKGGMGAVYRAIQESVEREVALKVLAPHFAKSPQAGDRFLREAKTAGKVNHPNVISIIDVGQERGQYYMALELVTGGDAEQLSLQEGGVLSERRALEIIRDAAKGLQAIMQAGLVHRDIKPANIFITEDGTAKLADLGLARSEAGEDRMTQTGATVGTPAFMSPEQAEGVEDLDIRSDIYALGATLYALLCGQPPYIGNSAWAVVAKAINDPIPDASLVNPALSKNCLSLIHDCMNKDREQRIQNPSELLQRVEAIIDQASTAAAQISQDTILIGGQATQTTPPTAANQGRTKEAVANRGRSKTNRKNKKTLLLAIAASCCLLLALAAIGKGKQQEAGAIEENSTANQSELLATANNPEEDETIAEDDEETDDSQQGPVHALHLSTCLEKVLRQLEESEHTPEYLARRYNFGIGHFGQDGADGPDIIFDGTRYEHGLAMHPPNADDSARALFRVPRRYRRLRGGVALNDSCPLGNFQGELRFRIYAGMKKIWESKPITDAKRVDRFDIAIPPIRKRVLTLEVYCNGVFHFAQAVWLDPTLVP